MVLVPYLMSVSILNIGRYIAITIVSTMAPTPIIRIGSMMDVSDWMLESTRRSDALNGSNWRRVPWSCSARSPGPSSSGASLAATGAGGDRERGRGREEDSGGK